MCLRFLVPLSIPSTAERMSGTGADGQQKPAWCGATRAGIGVIGVARRFLLLFSSKDPGGPQIYPDAYEVAEAMPRLSPHEGGLPYCHGRTFPIRSVCWTRSTRAMLTTILTVT